jgi:hypothetical protein
MKVTKSRLTQIIKEELTNALSEAETWMSQDDAYELGREDAVAVSQGEMEDARYQNNPIYMRGFEEQSDEIAAEQGDDSIHRDPEHDYDGDEHPEVYDDDGMWEGKNIEEAEGHAGVTYWPFIGGKIDKEEFQDALKHISDLKSKHKSFKSTMSNSESNNLLHNILDMEETLQSVGKRHSKKEYDRAMERYTALHRTIDKTLIRAERTFKRSKEPKQYAQDYKLPKQDGYSSSLFDEPKRERPDEPGFTRAGTNMGYGESLNRAKISKSELAQIIKEELKNILK